MVFRLEYTHMKSSLFGIVHQKFYWDHNVIHAMSTFGPLAAFLPKWPHENHFSKVILKLISSSECSGKNQKNSAPFVVVILFTFNLFIWKLFVYRILKTPTEDIWPGVTSLPDYKETFPCWTQKQLREQVKVINSSGYDLLDLMLTYNPVHRISAKKILEHKYFDGFDKKLVPTMWTSAFAKILIHYYSFSYIII